MSAPQPQLPVERPPTFSRVLLQVLRKPFLRNILIACLAVALLFPLYNRLYLTPAYRQMLAAFNEGDARRVAAHLVRMLKLGDQPVSAQSVDPALISMLDDLKIDFQLDKLRLIDPDARVVFSTETREVGQVNIGMQFTQKAARQQTHSQVVTRQGLSRQGRATVRDVVQVYVPVMKARTFLGAFEIDFDISAGKKRHDQLVWHSDLALGCIAILMMAIVVVSLFKAGRAMLAHRKMDEELHSARDQLEKRVKERTQALINANKDLEMEILERRQAEADLRESEQRFRNLIETIPYGIQEVDLNGSIRFANPAHSLIYGYGPEELVGRSILDLAAGEEEGKQLRAHFDYLVAQHPRPSPWFGKDRTKGGIVIDIQVDWNYQRDVQGRVTGFIMVISNITHRKKAEKALLDNLQFMNTLIDTLPNPVFYKDAQGIFLGCNVAYANTLGVAKSDITGRRLIDIQSVRSSEMALHYHEQDQKFMQQSGIQSYEERVHCADGEQRDFILYKATFKDADLQVAGLVGIMLDITHRKKVEKELKESKDLFDAFMQHMPGLVFMKDLQGRYIYVNQAFAQFTATKTKDALGRYAHQVWGAQTAMELQANDEKVYHFQSAHSNMETVRASGGKERFLLTSRFPIFQDEALFAMGGISMDVTERTLARQQRQQMKMQLQQSQKMEALGTLAGGIAHDFNNILAAIIGYTEIAVADIDKADNVHHYLKRVLEAGERARALVKQILAFSRQGEMEPRPVQVKLIVKEVLKLLRASLPATINIQQVIETDSAVMADPTQLHQVMMNLGTNAGYAMGETGGTLTVTLEQVALDQTFCRQRIDLKPGAYLKLAVSDTGKGIDPEHLARIFDPFFTTKPKGEGTGMGLAVVHGIVTALKGTICVDSTPGQGTRFELYLPAMAAQAREQIPQTATLPAGKERILFVDDEVFQTDMLTQMLGLLGYQVTAYNKSPEALAFFESDPSAFDLVISDVIMPTLTGDEMAKKMLALRPDLPIILATGYSEKISEAKALEMGVRAYALKPLVMEELSRLIRRVLDDQDK
jgi:PAS domain S-box-containing protein